MHIDITFRGMDPSLSAEMSARRWIERLRRVCSDITTCNVVIEMPHRHQERHHVFHVRVQLAVPGEVLAVTRDPGEPEAHEDVYVAIADAFRAARRRLQQYVAVRRHDVKHHEAHA